LDIIPPYIQAANIPPTPNKNSQSSSVDVNTNLPENHSTFEDLIKRTFNQDLLDNSVDELDISARAANALKAARCKTIEDVVNFRLTNLKALKNVGRTTIEELKNAILKHCESETEKGDAINSTDTINSLLASVSPRYSDIIKSRYGTKMENAKPLRRLQIKKVLPGREFSKL